MKSTKKILDENKLEQLVYECAMSYIKNTPELRKKLLEKKEKTKKQKANESKKQQITYKMLFEMVKNSVKSLLKEDEIDDFGTGLDLDNTTKAYDLGNVDKHWTDYSNDFNDDESGWDEESYYNDFDDWWKSLPREEKERIYNEMK